MTAKKATLKRLLAGEGKSDNPLRTDIVDGFFVDEPELGRSFRFFSTPLDPKMTARVVITSAVKNVRALYGHINYLNAGFEIETESGSVYRVDVLPDEDATLQ